MIDRKAIKRVIDNWQNPQFMKLHAGEMSAQEIRTVRAIVRVVGWEIDQILLGVDEQSGETGEKS